MIRRQPTAIKLTPEDVLNYDDEKTKPGFNQNVSSQNSVLQERKTKEERIGIRPTNR